jgi:hypothetical protein
MYLETMTEEAIVRSIVMSGGVKGRSVLAGPGPNDRYADYSRAPKAPRDINDLPPQEFYASLKAQQPAPR